MNWIERLVSIQGIVAGQRTILQQSLGGASPTAWDEQGGESRSYDAVVADVDADVMAGAYLAIESTLHDVQT